MLIDIHAHHHPLAYLEAVTPMIGEPRRASFLGQVDTDEAGSIQKRLEMMDAAGVALQVLSPMAGLAPYSPDAAVAAKAAVIGNAPTPSSWPATRPGSRPSSACRFPTSTLRSKS